MNTPRTEVYKAIDTERDYQDGLVLNNGWNSEKAVAEYLTLMRVYLRKAEDDWSTESDAEGNLKSLQQVRKLAAIAVACMEKHGAPHRKLS